MFSVQERERLRDLLLQQARSDSRVVSAAAVGSSAEGGERWSDLDLTFGVADGVPVHDVLSDWTQVLQSECDAAVLFDLPSLTTIYRVFLLPGALQVDLSFSPASDFGARGPRFQLLFGEAVERPFAPPQTPEHIFGLGVHHAVRAHICLQRERLWQAEYWIHEARDQALSLACSRRSLEISHGRGFDRLSPEVLAPFQDALVRSLAISELSRALASAINCLLREAGDIPNAAATWLRSELQRLCSPAEAESGKLQVP